MSGELKEKQTNAEKEQTKVEKFKTKTLNTIHDTMVPHAILQNIQTYTQTIANT